MCAVGLYSWLYCIAPWAIVGALRALLMRVFWRRSPRKRAGALEQCEGRGPEYIIREIRVRGHLAIWRKIDLKVKMKCFLLCLLQFTSVEQNTTRNLWAERALHRALELLICAIMWALGRERSKLILFEQTV